MKKLLAILLSVILVIGTVIGANAVVYYYGSGGPDMTLNFYIDSSKVPATTFTEIEMKIFSSFNTYAEQSVKLDGKWVSFGTVKAESNIEGAELTTGYTEKQGAVTILKFKSDEGFEIADNQPFLSITNVNAALYTSNDSIDYIVDKLVGSDGTDYADKDAVTTDLKIPEGTYATHPCEGALYVNNLNITTPTVNNIDFGFEPYKIAELKDGYSLWYCHQPVPPWMEMFYYQYGRYIFVNQFGQGENCHGFYIQKDNKQLMLSQAFEEGITDIDEVVSLIMSADIPLFNKTHIVDTAKVQGNWEDLFPEFHINQSDSTEPPTDPPATATEPSSKIQATQPTESSTEPESAQPVVTPEKKANPMKVTVKAKTVKFSKVKKSKQIVAPITVKNAQGKVTFKKLSGSNTLMLKANGNIVIKKGAKKGTYTAKIKVTANGSSKYKNASKTVKIKITVK